MYLKKWLFQTKFVSSVSLKSLLYDILRHYCTTFFVPKFASSVSLKSLLYDILRLLYDILRHQICLLCLPQVSTVRHSSSLWKK